MLIDTFLEKLKERRIRYLVYFVVASLFFIVFGQDNFLFKPKAKADAMCQVPVDVVLIMDVSGSMNEGENSSRCEWWNQQFDEGTWKWFLNKTYDVDQTWCDTKNLPSPRQSTFYPATPKKINAAKDAANSFLSNLGPNDQSAIVSFSNTATLLNPLSNNHTDNQSIINSLTTGGSTNISSAIAAGIQELDDNGNESVSKAIVLLTDGKANLPNGSGLDENPDDVQLAIDKAQVAAGPDRNYKIFTIGLGSDSDINQTMLQQIADITLAEYYHAPNGNGLSEIYQQISQKICEHSSIKVCKYLDSNNDGDIAGESKLGGWNITLTGGANGPQTRFTENNEQSGNFGCYIFTDLQPGIYTLNEEVPQGEDWIQTIPNPDPITLDWEQNITGIYFANYHPVCGNNILDDNEQCDDGPQGSDLCTSQCALIEQTPIYQCSDDLDNDEDGLIDELDPGCYDTGVYDPTDNNETNTLPQCSDNFDNDGDGKIDYPTDSGCENGADNNEADIIPGSIQPGEVVINELMWMGSEDVTYGSSDEWIELFNKTDKNIVLNSCYLTKLISGIETSMLIIVDNTLISSHNYFIISNYNKEISKININPDVVNSAVSLHNTNLQIKLICDGIQIDVAGDGNVPLTGDNGTPKKSMSRKSAPGDGTLAENWCTASTQVNWDVGATEKGTPGAQNDCGGEPPAPICGNGQIESGEQCDDGDLNGEPGHCNETCNGEIPQGPVCGNAIQEDGETCDEGALINGTQGHCNATCNGQTPAFFCTSTISGTKYNGNPENNIVLENWEIKLYKNGEVLATTTTNIDGNYIFEDICLGDYEVREVEKESWSRLSPSGGYYSIHVDAESMSFTEKDFINVQYSSISGYKYQDADGDATTTADQTVLSGWTINLFKDATTTTEIATTTTDSLGHFAFENLLPGNYYLTENLTQDWQQLSGPSAVIVLTDGTNSQNNNFINYYTGGQGGPEPICGNGVKETGETCDGSDGVTTGYHCTSACLLEADNPPAGGGGGGGNTNYCGNNQLDGNEDCDGYAGTVPNGYVCNSCHLVKIEVPGAGAVAGEETGLPAGEAGGVGGGEEGAGAGPAGGAGTTGGEIAGGTTTGPGVAGAQTGEGEVKGEEEKASSCDWFDRLLIILLLIAINIVYYLLKNGEEKEKEQGKLEI